MTAPTGARAAAWLRSHRKWLAFVACMAIFLCFYAQFLSQNRQTPIIGNSIVSVELDKPVGGMTAQVWVEQGFVCDTGELSGFRFRISSFGGNLEGQLIITLLDDAQNVLFEVVRDVNELDLYRPNRFFLDEPVQNAQGRHFILRFHCDTTKDWQDALTLWYGKSATALEPAYLNGQQMENPIAFQWYGPRLQAQGWLSALGFGLLGLCAAAFCLCEAKRLPPHKVFVLFAMLLSLFYVLAFPYDAVPDERRHYTRACTIANGQLMPDENAEGRVLEGQLPLEGLGESTLRNTWLERGQRIGEQSSLVSVGNTALYTPVGYLPQALGIRLGMLLTRRTYLVIYLARLVNWAVSVSVMALAIRHTPRGKWVMAGMGLTAICLRETVSLAVDGIGFALSFAMTALVLGYFCDPAARVDRRGAALLLLCSFLLAATKTLYVPIALLALLIPARCFSGRRQHVALKAGVLAVGPCAAVVWSRYAASLIHLTANASVDVAAQTAFILEDPLRYASILFRTLEQQGVGYLTGMVCSPFPGLDVAPSWLAVALSFLGLAILFVRQPGLPAKRHTAALRWVLLALSVLIILISMTGEYLQWTAVGDDTVLGVQGRYFLPLVPLLFLAFRTPGAQPAGAADGQAQQTGCLWGIFLIAAADVICLMAVLCLTIA